MLFLQMIEKVRSLLALGFPVLVPELQAMLGGGFFEMQGSYTFQPVSEKTAEDAPILPEAGLVLRLNSNRTHFTQLKFTLLANLSFAGRTDVLSITGAFMDLRNPSSEYQEYFRVVGSGLMAQNVETRIATMLAYSLVYVEYKARELTENGTLELVGKLSDAHFARLVAYFQNPVQTEYSGD